MVLRNETWSGDLSTELHTISTHNMCSYARQSGGATKASGQPLLSNERRRGVCGTMAIGAVLRTVGLCSDEEEGTVRRIPFLRRKTRCRMPNAARPGECELSQPLFVCVPKWAVGSARTRIVVMGRFFRLGWVRDIGADARVPQLASFRLLRFRSASAGGLISWRRITGQRFEIGDFALHRATVCIAPPELSIRADPTGPRRPPRTAHPAPSKYRCHTARAAKPSRIHCREGQGTGQ
jgi:hypothetical protein